MNRLKVLIVAYACEPGRGSEPGVGWSFVNEVAKSHDVWVLTRANNRSQIEAAKTSGCGGPEFIYYDLPRWARWWKRGPRGVQLYYYLWQITARAVVRRWHSTVRFDLVHHLTFGKHWSPTAASQLALPFVWGPLGGGESAPLRRWTKMGPRGAILEALRAAARWLGERDPLVREAARRCTIALAKTEETAKRTKGMGAREARIMSEVAFAPDELARLRGLRAPQRSDRTRFAMVGRLVPLKGFHLTLEAFGKLNRDDLELWVIGDGPERRRLERLAVRYSVENQTTFHGAKSRDDALRLLGRCDALLHPTLHDSGGWVCLEAMSMELPVVCLELGGPATQVTAETGILVKPTGKHDDLIGRLAEAISWFADHPIDRAAMGQRGRAHVHQMFSWRARSEEIDSAYGAAIGAASPIH